MKMLSPLTWCMIVAHDSWKLVNSYKQIKNFFSSHKICNCSCVLYVAFRISQSFCFYTSYSMVICLSVAVSATLLFSTFISRYIEVSYRLYNLKKPFEYGVILLTVFSSLLLVFPRRDMLFAKELPRMLVYSGSQIFPPNSFHYIRMCLI